MGLLRFSDRRCPVCLREIPGAAFGAHISTHAPSEFEEGMIGALKTLALSLEISITEAEGHPAQQEALRWSLAKTEAMLLLAKEINEGDVHL